MSGYLSVKHVLVWCWRQSLSSKHIDFSGWLRDISIKSLYCILWIFYHGAGKF